MIKCRWCGTVLDYINGERECPNPDCKGDKNKNE